jgi:hypothetical protein
MSFDIKLDSFYMGNALAGHLCGHHEPETLIQNAKANLKRIWGKDRPVLIVPPGPGLGSNPRVCLACLDGPAKEKDDDGSWLFVIWFRDGYPSDPLQEALTHVEQQGGWDLLAKGYFL